MLYLFDLDGTLISSYMDEPGRGYHNWRVLSGRREKLIKLAVAGHNIAIVTNQGGVAFGFIDEQVAWFKIYEAARQCGLPPDTIRTYACFHDIRGQPPYNDPEQAARRKPSGAMIVEAMRDTGATNPHEGLYVGDREEDLKAAQNAGVAFQWAHIFFKEEAE
jgi:D-glycero-D-manno-heptose 1,7-bisphosphate phosphatase